LFGFIIGIANIIPGVSGGTFALILGIYPRLLDALGAYDAPLAGQIYKKLKTRQFTDLRKLILTDQFYFLAALGAGAVLAILLLSRLLKYCLENHYEATYGLFLGLIVFSIPIPYRLLNRKSVPAMFWMVVGIGLTLLISVQVDPAVKLLEKSHYYQMILEGGQALGLLDYGLSQYVSVFFVGMLAISAMVLPGISGSFILLVFGMYYQVISAISRIQNGYPEDLMFLGVFAAGNLCGLVVFVRLFNYLYKRFQDQTIFFLIGLMVGSLYALWPFKAFQITDIYIKINDGIALVHGYKAYGNTVRLWDGIQELVPVVSTFLLGAALMFFFSRRDKPAAKS